MKKLRINTANGLATFFLIYAAISVIVHVEG